MYAELLIYKMNKVWLTHTLQSKKMRSHITKDYQVYEVLSNYQEMTPLCFLFLSSTQSTT